MRWFRFYDEVLDDPKVQKLPVALRWHWVNVLCLANRGTPRGILPTMQAVAFALRVAETSAVQLIDTLKAAGLLDETPKGLMPHNWLVRQPDSDDAAVRMRRGRWAEPPPNTFRTSSSPEERRGDEIQRRSTTVLGDREFLLPPDALDRWILAYPAVDVRGELRAAFEWVQANPANKKSNWQRFLVAWLKRAQDRAPAKGNGPTDPPKIRPAILDEPPPDVRPMTPEEREKIARFTSGVTATMGRTG